MVNLLSDLSALQNSFEGLNANLKKVFGPEKTNDTFAQMFNTLATEIKSAITQSDLGNVDNSEDQLNLVAVDGISNWENLMAEDAASNQQNLQNNSSPDDAENGASEIEAPMLPQITLSLRRAVKTEGHKWHNANIISVYDSASKYQEEFGSHKVNGIEIIPGADGYDEDAAAAFLAQARQRAAVYWNG